MRHVGRGAVRREGGRVRGRNRGTPGCVGHYGFATTTGRAAVRTTRESAAAERGRSRASGLGVQTEKGVGIDGERGMREVGGMAGGEGDGAGGVSARRGWRRASGRLLN